MTRNWCKIFFVFELLLTCLVGLKPAEALANLTDQPKSTLSETETIESIQERLKACGQLNSEKNFGELKKCLDALEPLLADHPNSLQNCEFMIFSSIVDQQQNSMFQALELAEKARLLALKLQNSKYIAQSCIQLANVLLELRNYEFALEYLKTAREQAEKNENIPQARSVLISLGVCYWMLEDPKTAEDYFSLALTLAEKTEPHYYYILTNIGMVVEEQGNYPKTAEIYNRTLRYFEKTKNIYAISLTLCNMAKMEVNQGHAEQAIELANQSIQYAMQIESDYILAPTYRYLGRAYALQGEAEEAFLWFQKSLEVALNIQDTGQQIKTNRRMIDWYVEQQQYQKALELHLKLDEKQKQILNNKAQSESTILKIRFETEQKENEIEKLNSEKKQIELSEMQAKAALQIAEQNEHYQIKLRNLMTILFVIVVIVAIWWFFKTLQERDLRRKIEAHEKELEASQTQLLKSNHTLKELNEEKDTLLGIVAHDLRDPICAQIGVAQLFLNDFQSLSENDVKTFAESFIGSAQRMESIVTRLLDIRKLEGGNIKASWKPARISKIVETVHHQFDLQLSRKSQHLETEVDPTFDQLTTDPMLLDQVIQNLVSNAIKYSPQGKPIRLKVYKEHQHILFTIEDEGPGISEADQSKLFKKFGVTTNLPTGGESSIGLGLSIVKHLTEILRGEIWVESQIGKGSKFHLRLPIDPQNK